MYPSKDTDTYFKKYNTYLNTNTNTQKKYLSQILSTFYKYILKLNKSIEPIFMVHVNFNEYFTV